MLLNPKETKDEIVQWIRSYFAENGASCLAIIGISGGKDSSVVAALCVEALGKERVVGVLMPNGVQSDIDDSYKLIKNLDITYHVINILDTVTSLTSGLADVMSVGEQARINMPPRIRMATLYAVAQSTEGGGRVANTCNLSEEFIGYSTKFGDNTGDFSPLSNLLMHEVCQIGVALELPLDLVEKTPSDGLCGLTDEDNFGFSYEALDKYLLTGECEYACIKESIDSLHNRNLHKKIMMPAYGEPVRV